MPIKVTRALPNAALDGSLNNAEFRMDENFGFEVPVSVPGVDSMILDPRQTWANGAEFDAAALKLLGLFADNFETLDRKSVVSGKRVSVSVDVGCGRLIKKKSK